MTGKHNDAVTRLHGFIRGIKFILNTVILYLTPLAVEKKEAHFFTFIGRIGFFAHIIYRYFIGNLIFWLVSTAVPDAALRIL